MSTRKTYDFAIVGAGVFGAWTARYLRRSGASLVLLDAYGAGNSRSSSGGETRVIRAGYGPDELYTRWAIRSLPLWREFFAEIGRELFIRTEFMWVSEEGDAHITKMWELLNRLGVKCERLGSDDLSRLYPQLRFPGRMFAVLEPESGVLMARSSVRALFESLDQAGVECRIAQATTPGGEGKLTELKLANRESICAGTFIFACGPWLPKLFPDILASRIFPTRQEVFFLGVPAGDRSFSVGKMPAWLHHSHADRPYMLPDIENRGFKFAFDTHGPNFDPDSGARVVEQPAIECLRRYLKDHVPALHQAPIVETRVCQYENTWNGDFLIDRHPDFENVWLVGGGSGHGFKHGPVVGEYLSARILHNAPEEPRFSLSGKRSRQAREVY